VKAVLDNPRVLRSLGAVVLLASVVMFGALFVPFARQGCIFCPGATPGSTFTLPSFSLMQGLDGWIVLLVVVALAFESTASLLTVRRRATVIASLVLSAAALALGVLEGVDSAGRVVGLDRTAQPVGLGSGVAVHGITPPAYWVLGFYLFVAAAVVAFVASAVLAIATSREGRRPPEPIVAALPPVYGH
jgi:hypothetical protein